MNRNVDAGEPPEKAFLLDQRRIQGQIQRKNMYWLNVDPTLKERTSHSVDSLAKLVKHRVSVWEVAG